ncbi:YfhO family protein [Enterococcus diestrammenae]|uniref:YfhO family protein n=1 Tax=Enterococcus diestrammenae TaxID=1155073 RepID=A0ABV0F3H9_9ENTE|nr:YfhO family protein [Enterococcus diestrammenae]KAF1294987.1 hypothetical protein BAU18_04650 [Enterococcus diestrammenae]
MAKKHRIGIWAQYSIIFILVTGFILLPYHLQNKSLIHRYDALQQHIVAIKNIRIILGEILNGNFSFTDFWSWNLGIGADQFQIYSYYGMGDIFTYIGLLFDNYDTTFCVIMISKLYVAGLGMLLLLKNKKIYSTFGILGGTFVYLICGYTIHSSTSHPMFLTPIVVLPFFLLSIDRLFADRRSFLISVILMWALVSNFYFAVFVIIAGAVYFFMMLFDKEKGYFERWKMVLNVAIKLLLGIGMSSIFLIPTVYAFLHSTRAEVPFANGTILYPLKFYINFFSTYLLPPFNRSYEFHGTYALITLPAVCYVFMNFRKYRNVCIGLILLGLGFISPIFAATINGLATPSLRWEFLLGIPLAFATAIFIDSITKITKKQFIIISIASSLFVVLANFTNGLGKEISPYVAFLLLILAVLLAILPFSRHTIKSVPLVKCYLVAITLFNVTFSGFYYNSEFGNNYAAGHIDREATNKYYDDYLYGMTSDLKKVVNSQSFYRLSNTRKANNPSLGSAINNRSNVGAWSGIPMVNSYFSLQNENLGNFSSYYENTDMVMTEPLRNLDNRSVLSDYLGIKYLISKQMDDRPLGYDLKSKRTFNDQTVYLFESKHALPLLYGIDKVTSTHNSQNGVVREQLLPIAVAIDDKENPEIFDKYKNISPSDAAVEEVPIIVSKDEMKYTIELNDSSTNSEEEFEYFIRISNPKITYVNSFQNIKEYINQHPKTIGSLVDAIKEESKVSPSGSTISIFQGEKLLNLKYIYGNHEPSSFVPVDSMLFNLGNSNNFSISNEPLTIQLSSTMNIDLGKIEVFKSCVSKDTYRHFDELDRSSLGDLEINNGLITATSNFNTRKIISSSIPFSDGWQVEVDGKKIDTFIVNSGFLGFDIEKSGKHSIVIRYQTPLLKVSIFLSVFSIIIFIFWKFLINRYVRKH